MSQPTNPAITTGCNTQIYGITARQFNACRVSLEGKIAACKAGQEHAIASLKEQITSLGKKVQGLEKKSSKHFALHQKKGMIQMKVTAQGVLTWRSDENLLTLLRK